MIPMLERPTASAWLRPLDSCARRLGLSLVIVCLLLARAGELGAQTAPGPDVRLRIAGSDLMGDSVERLLRDHATDYEMKLSVEFHGSRLAQDRLAVGLVDLAVLVEYPGAVALPEGWAAVRIGYLTTVVVAPASLSLDHISFADLGRVFGANSCQANLRWGELGGRGEWVGVPVRPIVTSSAGGLAEPIFRREVLKDGALKAEIPRFHDNAEALQVARAEEGALALLTRLPEDESKLKALLVHATVEQVAFGPTPENLHAGDYPLRLPVRLVFERKRTAALLPLLRLWHSEEMATSLASAGVVPLPTSVRNQQVFELEVTE